MGASAISRTSGSCNHVKITILKPPSPKHFSASSKLKDILSLSPPTRLPITEDVKGESEQTDRSICDNLRSNARRKKIVWQPTTPEPSLKVQYVNIASAAPISPDSSTRTKSATMTPSPSTTPSPVERVPGSFSEVSNRRNSSKSMHDFTAILETDKLPLTYQHKSPGSKTPLPHTKTRYKLNVPRQTLAKGLLTSEEIAPEEQSECGQFLFTIKTRRKDQTEGGKSCREEVNYSRRPEAQ